MMTEEKLEEWLNHIIRIPVGSFGIFAIFIGIYTIGDGTISVLDSSTEPVFFTLAGSVLVAYGIRGNKQKISTRNESRIFQLVRVGNIAIIKAILAPGFTSELNLNIKDDVTGQTPLDCAIARDHTEIASLLRKYGGKTSEELKVQRN